MLISNQPTFKGLVTAGPVEEKTNHAQDGLMTGYITALFDKDNVIKAEKTDGGKLLIEAIVEKLPFQQVLTQKGFEDRSASEEPRKVKMALTDDSFELVYDYAEYPENNWFDKLTWKMDKDDVDRQPQAYKTYLGMLKSYFEKLS